MYERTVGTGLNTAATCWSWSHSRVAWHLANTIVRACIHRSPRGPFPLVGSSGFAPAKEDIGILSMEGGSGTAVNLDAEWLVPLPLLIAKGLNGTANNLLLGIMQRILLQNGRHLPPQEPR